MNPKAILVATDFSECACSAFRAAKDIARRFEAKLILLHVLNLRRVEWLSEHLKVDPDMLVHDLREQAQQELSAFLGRCDLEQVETEALVAVGLPFQEISVIARDLAVDLVVLGGYGRGGRGPIEEVFFGSTAEKVVRLLPCPVLCIPLEGKGAAD